VRRGSKDEHGMRTTSVGDRIMTAEPRGGPGDRTNGAKPNPLPDRLVAALDADQAAAQADQTAANSDQTAADADEATAERDQELAESDQRASDRDQATSDRELATGPISAADQEAHDASKAEREDATADRHAAAWLRGEAKVERLGAAAHRDESARQRDIAAEARDRVATIRDRLTPPGAPGAAERVRAASDRVRAAKDRERAAADRMQAAIDRDHARQALLETHLDELTGTYRRGMGTIALQAEIERARRSAGRLVLAFVDVDGLKQFNDREGHAAGDALLIDVVATIRSNLRSYDPVVRFGGDEFVCALGDADLKDARRRFDGIQTVLGTVRKGCSISVGFACLEAGDTLGALTARADAALYEAKRARRFNDKALDE
jgi:diguanylate cyclase (GGDEF)-like protein